MDDNGNDTSGNGDDPTGGGFGNTDTGPSGSGTLDIGTSEVSGFGQGGVVGGGLQDTGSNGGGEAGTIGGFAVASSPGDLALVGGTIGAITAGTVAAGVITATAPGAAMGAIAATAGVATQIDGTAFGNAVSNIATDLAHAAGFAALSPGIFATDAQTAAAAADYGNDGSIYFGGGITADVGSNGVISIFQDQTANPMSLFNGGGSGGGS